MKKVEKINQYESYIESEFPSWKRGIEKRRILLEILQKNDSIPLEQAAQILGISVQQVKRHRRILIAEGLLKDG